LVADTTTYAVDSAAPAQGDTYSAAVYTSDDVDKQAEYTGDSFTYNGNLHTENGAPNDNYEVLVSYVVDEDGFVIDVYALTNNGYGLEEEIVAAIQRTSGAWNAAKKNGATVKCRIENTFSFPDANK
jgi:flagellar hook assembly protein FlgD